MCIKDHFIVICDFANSAAQDSSVLLRIVILDFTVRYDDNYVAG